MDLVWLFYWGGKVVGMGFSSGCLDCLALCSLVGPGFCVVSVEGGG